MSVYVIEFVIKLTVICFKNNIKSLLNVAKQISTNGIGQCGIEIRYPQEILTLASQLGVKV